MNKIYFLAILLFSAAPFANDAKNEWHDTTLSDATIGKIQDATYQYKKCVSDEMQKTAYQNQESRRATDAIMKQCEATLTKMRDVYLAEKVPEIIADRHLKQLRIKTTRSALQEMMFSEAARKTGQH